MVALRGSLPRLTALLGLLLLGTAATPPPLPAQEKQSFLDAYKTGVEALAAEDWLGVERAMRAAVAGRPEEAERLVRHLHLRPYLPHFYLGLALAERGECAEALEELAESERQGVVTGLADELAILRARQSACRERLATEARAAERRRAVDAVEALVASTGRSAASVAALAEEPDLAGSWERGDPSLATRLAEAQSALGEARVRLSRGAAEPAGTEDGTDRASDLAAATDLARGALAQIEAIRREAEVRMKAFADDREAAAKRIASLAGAGRDLLASTRDLAAAPAVESRRRAMEEALGRAAETRGEGTLAELRDLAGRLERSVAELRAVAAPPPAALLEAAAAWTRGEPAAVLGALAGPGPQEPRARAHALLLRAAAAFALHEAGGGTDPELLAAAGRDVASCKLADPRLEPLPGVFSPRFRAFFAEVAAAPPTVAPTR